ncbi:MAG: hypothetical protein HC913_20230 [Microscillaceae bacterium]|nr:hypothetical protein [Microscillaceae bacterium]
MNKIPGVILPAKGWLFYKHTQRKNIHERIQGESKEKFMPKRIACVFNRAGGDGNRLHHEQFRPGKPDSTAKNGAITD